MVKIEHEENKPKGRFIVHLDEEFVGEMTYSWAGDDSFIIDHTFVVEKYRGNDYAKQLVMAAVDYAREKDVKIKPLCSYVKAVFDREASIADVKD